MARHKLETLNPRQKQAVLMVCGGAKSPQIAERLGVAVETVRGWRADPRFQAEANRLISENQQAHSERLRGLAGLALDTLENVLCDESARPGAKVAAAKVILERAGVESRPAGPVDPAEIEQSAQIEAIIGGVIARITTAKGE